MVSPPISKAGHSHDKSSQDDVGHMDQPYDPTQEAKMEKAIRILEKEMAGVDEEHPDPRQLGRLMRRMSEITEEKMPEEMTEAVKRLESGEDPEKIEEDLGDLFGDGEHNAGCGYGGPMRDPGLYDF